MYLAKQQYCEELYILTKVGRKFEVDFYYDTDGNIHTRADVLKQAKRTLPQGFTPAYGFNFLLKMFSNIDTAENLATILCICLAKHNRL